MSPFSRLMTGKKFYFCFFQACFLFGFIFSNLIYSSFTTLGDGYDPITFNFQTSSFDRTQIVLLIYKILSFIFPHKVSSFFLCVLNGFLAWAIWCNIRSASVRQIYVLCFSSIFFLAWASIPSKEQVVITFTFFSFLILQNMFSTRDSFSFLKILLYVFSVSVISYIRYPLALYLIPLFVLALRSRINFKNFSIFTGLIAFALIILFCIILNDLLFEFPILSSLRSWVSGVKWGFFGYNAGSNREYLAGMYDELWYIPYGIFSLILPVGIMDSTEALKYFVIFLAGIPALLVCLKIVFEVFTIRKSNEFVVMLSIWIPVILVAVVVFSPYVAFNGGASLRYVQSIYPALTIFPLILLDWARQTRCKN